MMLMQGALGMIMSAFAPVAVGTVTVGLLVTLLQSWLHWNDVSLSFVPKLLLVVVILVFGWWTFVTGFTHWFHALSLVVV